MANNVVKFYRGLAASYNPITHADGIYFATDTKKIIMNNAEYGGDSNKKVSDVALNANANGIVITYTDSTSTTLLLGKATVTADGLMSKEDKTKLDSLDLSGIKGSTVKVGVAITGGAEIGADQTVAEGMKALSDSIKTAVAGSITSITSPDNTIKVTGEGTSRGLAVDMSKLVSTSSSIQVGTDGKLDIFWSEIE